MKREITCTECPMGCTVTVETDGGEILSITGNTCPRGKMYAESEVTDPKRVVTSTVRCIDGSIVSVKTDRPVRKSEIFNVMSKINGLHPAAPLKIGDIIFENIDGDANLVVTSNSESC